jgi:alpha-beta hydrolase superfamily lysophospholipase
MAAMGVIGPKHFDVDITGQVGIDGPLHTCVTVHLPDASTLANPPVVIFAFPGGGASRAMYCMEAPTTLAFSQARWHAERGVVFVSCDHLGTGGSSHPDPALLSTPYPVAWANEATVNAVLKLLEGSGVVDGYPAVVDPVVLGIGHSMGANLTIVLQAHRETFDGIAVLGYSAIHTALPHPPSVDPRPPRRPPRGHPTNGRDLSGPWSHAQTVRRYMNRWDAEEAAEVRRHEWDLPLASRTMPPAAGFMNAAGVVAEEASWIEVPVFLGFGERDVTRNQWEEPRYYWRSRDVTLAVIPRMSHGMNSASTRVMLWERLQHWAEGTAAFASAESHRFREDSTP